MPRKIIHIDMDAFYAAVEQRDKPRLRGQPVIVGGDPASRGVVATCSYEARRFGVHSAMAAARAARLCPGAIFVRPRFEVYRAVSAEIRAVFHEFTDLVEPLSLDEAFLDVTENKRDIAYGSRVAREILAEIRRRTDLSASAGVSYNKFLAKIASDLRKPGGLTVITPDQAPGFIADLPVRRFHGIGQVTEKRLLDQGIANGADLRRCSKEALQKLFGRSGEYFYNIARGIDHRPVVPNRIRKSIGKETTLAADCSDRQEMRVILRSLAERVAALMRRRGTSGLTLTLKVKYHDFQNVTRSTTVDQPLDEASAMLQLADDLLAKTEAGQRPIRLLGLTISNLTTDLAVEATTQLELPFAARDEDRLLR